MHPVKQIQKYNVIYPSIVEQSMAMLYAYSGTDLQIIQLEGLQNYSHFAVR